MSNPLKRLAGQTAVYGLSSIVGRLLNYLLVPLYVSVFVHTSDYGVISELYAWIAFLMVLLTFGMETTFFKFLSDHPERKEAIFRNAMLSVLSINVLFYILIIVLRQPIADAMLYPDNPEFVFLLGSVVFIDAISALPLAKLRAEERAKRFALIQLTGIGINIGLNLVLMLLIFQPESQNAAVGIRFILISNVIASLVKPIFLYKDFLSIKIRWHFKLVRSMLKYSLPLMIAGFAYIINETVDRILLKYVSYEHFIPTMGTHDALMYSESQVGIYSASYKLAMLVTIFLQAYRYAAEPFFFNESKNKNRNQTYRKVMNYFVGAVFLFFLFVSLNLDIFKYFIPNPDYWVGLKVVPILLLANVWSGIYINQSIWYKLSGQTKFGAYISIGGAILTLLICFIFIPVFGYMACAWATFFVYFGQMVVSYILGQKHYPIPYSLKKFFLYGATAILIFFFYENIIIENTILRIVLHNGTIICYAAMIFFLEWPRKQRWRISGR